MPMNIFTKFHACIRMCMIIVISRSTTLKLIYMEFLTLPYLETT